MLRFTRDADQLIFSLYKAVEDREQLPAFFSQVGKQFGAHVVGLRGHDAGYSSRKYFDCVGFPLAEWAHLENQLVDGHPWHKKGFADMLRDGVGHSGTIMSDRELERTQFHEIVLRPMQIGYGMGICLWARPPGEMVVLSINRLKSLGSFGDGDMRFAKSLLPHFRSAYAILRRLRETETRLQSLNTAFERLRIGVVLTDVEGRCCYRNEAADVLLHSRRGLALSVADTLRCASPATQHVLLDALRRAAGGELRRPESIHVRDASGALSCVLVVTMLHVDLTCCVDGPRASAAVFMHARTASEGAHAETALQAAFGLTSAEARLAALIVTHLQPKECADALGISTATVRTQLRGLFAKTGTRRQAELVSSLTFALQIR